jgi:hypothetical protein
MKRIIISLVVSFMTLSVVSALPAATVLADAVSGSQGSACAGASLGGTDVCGGNSGTSIGSLISTVINILSVIVGAVAVIMIIIGGLKYITSGGESSKTASAKNTIIYALVGLVIAALAQVLIHFVLTKATNTSATITCPSGAKVIPASGQTAAQACAGH